MRKIKIPIVGPLLDKEGTRRRLQILQAFRSLLKKSIAIVILVRFLHIFLTVRQTSFSLSQVDLAAGSY
jgi:hypothetical protein